MELLTLIKQLLEAINKKGGKERISYGTVNGLAEEVFHHNYKRITEKIKKVGSDDNINNLLERIKELTNDKEK